MLTPDHITADQILEALRDCYDPQLALNIVDLGLVVKVDAELDVHAPGHGIPGVPSRSFTSVQLLAVGEDEASRAQLAAIVHNRLAGLPQLSRIEVHVLAEPQWTPARMSEQARQKLGEQAAKVVAEPFQILNNRAR